MTTHKTGTRDQWLKARLELLKAEKELTHRGDEVARKRQELPWVPINKGYRFETDEESASLADLFRDLVTLPDTFGNHGGLRRGLGGIGGRRRCQAGGGNVTRLKHPATVFAERLFRFSWSGATGTKLRQRFGRWAGRFNNRRWWRRRRRHRNRQRG